MLKTSYIAGLDLGKVQDYSALVVIERSQDIPDLPQVRVVGSAAMGKIEDVPADPPRKTLAGRRSPAVYRVRHIERFQIGTSYVRVRDRVVEIFSRPPLLGGTLVIDWTGVGVAMVDFVKEAKPRCSIRPVSITGGMSVSEDGAGWHVPKRELVSVIHMLAGNDRLKVGRTIPNSDVTKREIETFQVKITSSANETFESWRERDHDDIVLALAIAAWVGERGTRQYWLR